MKLTMIKLLALLLPAAAAYGQDSLLAVFWNLENFFDYRSEAAQEYWTRGRFYSKCDAVAKTLMLVADRHGRLPDIVGFAEIENAFVLRSIVSSTLLRKAGYGIVHYDSPDHRGIDCGLLYRRQSLELTGSSPIHVHDSSGAVMATRDILLAEFARFVGPQRSPMCGNTIGQDRRFMARWMPRLEAYFHYRSIDVSTLKELARRWKPEVVASFKKATRHEALSDILESIDELKHYREHMLKI